MVVGGDKLPYELDASSPAASMLETKLVANPVISDAARESRFLSCDLKDFFLATHIQRPEYINMAWIYFAPDIITKYKLQDICIPDGNVYCKISKGVYGIKQAAVLAYNELSTHLQIAGFQQVTGLRGCGHIH